MLWIVIFFFKDIARAWNPHPQSIIKLTYLSIDVTWQQFRMRSSNFSSKCSVQKQNFSKCVYPEKYRSTFVLFLYIFTQAVMTIYNFKGRMWIFKIIHSSLNKDYIQKMIYKL